MLKIFVAIIVIGLSAGACTTMPTEPPKPAYPESAYKLPDGSVHLTVGKTQNGLLLSSREAAGYHCPIMPDGTMKCVPVIMTGGTGPGILPVVAGVAAQTGSAVIGARGALEAARALPKSEINNININDNNLTQINRQTTWVNNHQQSY